MLNSPKLRIILLAAIFVGSGDNISRSEEHVTIRSAGTQLLLSGRTLVEAQDGGIYFESNDRQIWGVEPNDLLKHVKGEGSFQPLDRVRLKSELLAELPAGFLVRETEHYIIAYNTSDAYAKWCGSLYERLHDAFTKYWQRRGIVLQPTPPLVAVVFQDRRSFEEYGKTELGEAVKAVIGFYSLKTNRITTYDLTGVDQARGNFRSSDSIRKISHALMANPEAERTVATVIHEATHQLVFNSGMQQRFADIPVWLSEGLAIYFETPDLGRSRGWSTIGAVNRVRLAQLRKYLPNRSANSLKSLIVDDTRFHDTRLSEAAYAEAWALCYVLQKQTPLKKQFDQYLKLLQKKQIGLEDNPQTRLNEFESIFGPVKKLDARFLKVTSKLR
ncbi:DUF1570 domain-containing protein [Planctomycetota bacterium]